MLAESRLNEPLGDLLSFGDWVDMQSRRSELQMIMAKYACVCSRLSNSAFDRICGDSAQERKAGSVGSMIWGYT